MTDDLQFEKNMRKLSAITLICMLMTIPLNVFALIFDINASTSDINNTLATSVLCSSVLNIEEDTTVEEELPPMKPYNVYSKEEVDELAKIIMCEAEGESQKCKEYIGQVIMNRVNSPKFPDNIHDVIFDGHQFTPTFNGRWERVKPNEDCYNAAYNVLNSTESLLDEDAMWFEAFKKEDDIENSWHYNNLDLVAEEDGVRFYKLKE